MTEGSLSLTAVLLTAWDEIVRNEAGGSAKLVPPTRRSKSILRHGASEGTIAAAEERLGLSLPPSYREFVGISDGAYADPSGAITEAMLEHRQHTTIDGMGLLCVADVVPLASAEPLVVASFTRDAGSPGARLSHEGAAPVDTQYLLDRRALLVSAEWQSNLTALVPVGEDPEWQLWQFTRDDVRAFTSFRSWLEWAAKPPNIDHVMDLIRWTREGDERGHDLGVIRDAAALPILLAAFDEFPDDRRIQHGVLAAFGRIKDDRTVPIIESYLESSTASSSDLAIARRTLRRIGSPAAREVLVRHEAHFELVELKDPRAPEIAARRLALGEFWAATTIGQMPDVKYVPLLMDAWQRASKPGAKLDIAAALVACGASAGQTFLQDLANDEAFPFRRQASAILREIRPPASTT